MFHRQDLAPSEKPTLLEHWNRAGLSHNQRSRIQTDRTVELGFRRPSSAARPTKNRSNYQQEVQPPPHQDKALLLGVNYYSQEVVMMEQPQRQRQAAQSRGYGECHRLVEVRRPRFAQQPHQCTCPPLQMQLCGRVKSRIMALTSWSSGPRHRGSRLPITTRHLLCEDLPPVISEQLPCNSLQASLVEAYQSMRLLLHRKQS